MFGLGDIAGSSFGPMGNAGPSTASGTSPFNFASGVVNMGGAATTAQAITPWLVVGAVGLVGLWLVLRK
jgi:hypothetical protein